MVYDPYLFSDSDSDSNSGDSEASYEEEDSGEQYEVELVDQDVEMATPSEAGSIASEGDPVASGSGAYVNRSIASSPGPSVISLTESLKECVFREEFGRGLNNYSEVYRLPADEDEMERLNTQHRMLIDIMGAKYPPPIGPILNSSIPREKSVLDLGCGNGAWIKDIARDFPLCEAVAVDLIPIEDTDDFPLNLRSEIDDINLGLDHFYGKFDVVHSRLLAAGIKDYQLLIERISRILRPGGLIELAEVDFTVYDKYGRRIPISTNDPLGPPWMSRFMAYLSESIRASGGDLDAANHLYTWVSRHEAFENIVYRDIWLPAVPGNDVRYHQNVYELMKENVTAFVKSGRPSILGNGVSEEIYDTIAQNTLLELNESDVPQYTRLQCIYAIRNDVILAPLP